MKKINDSLFRKAFGKNTNVAQETKLDSSCINLQQRSPINLRHSAFNGTQMFFQFTSLLADQNPTSHSWFEILCLYFFNRKWPHYMGSDVISRRFMKLLDPSRDRTTVQDFSRKFLLSPKSPTLSQSHQNGRQDYHVGEITLQLRNNI
ncbi:hypothetical protein AVEN_201448-1 [Araneus ventricosus]|uniref:Uncharacterized protein n=1 Tax=Araneus ventricosus TaxID=182803 RepID=A0A4Y2JXV4_ARAVE|nr:hypothetical protein AVEN_201448-1 [Araneus ventricosus]